MEKLGVTQKVGLPLWHKPKTIFFTLRSYTYQKLIERSQRLAPFYFAADLSATVLFVADLFCGCRLIIRGGHIYPASDTFICFGHIYPASAPSLFGSITFRRSADTRKKMRPTRNHYAPASKKL